MILPTFRALIDYDFSREFYGKSKQRTFKISEKNTQFQKPLSTL